MTCEHRTPSALCQGCTWCAMREGIRAERRAVLLRVAGEIDLESYHHARNEGDRKRLVDLAAKYRREAEEGT